MTDLQKEYVECYNYCSTAPSASRKVLMELRRELIKQGQEIPAIVKETPKRVPTPEELEKDEVFMLALIEAMALDDELWLRYRFINPEQTLMDFYNNEFNKQAI